jgi:hypothetical protein
MITFTPQGRMLKDGKPYLPAFFAVDYRAGLHEYERLLDGMMATGMTGIRVNMAVSARGSYLCLHDRVAPGVINQEAARNLKELFLLCESRGMDLWLNWLHKGGAGTTVPMDWTTAPETTAMAWEQSPWNRKNGGPVAQLKQCLDEPLLWFPYIDYIFDTYGNHPNFVHFTIATEGYNMDWFRDDSTRPAFMQFQSAIYNRAKSNKNCKQLISTGDGTIMLRGRPVANYINEQDVFICHNHPKQGDAKPRIISLTEEPLGFFFHRAHPMMSHIPATAKYWCGALGMGQYVEPDAETREQFGEMRTNADYIANIEYAFSNNLGLGSNWDNEGHLVTFNAPTRYGAFADWFRSKAIYNNEEILFTSDQILTPLSTAHLLVSQNRVLFFNPGEAAIRITTPWGIESVSGLYGSVDRPTPPVEPTPPTPPSPAPQRPNRPKRGFWAWLSPLFT